MASFRINGRLPPMSHRVLTDVTAEERSGAIDFINRHNFIFQEFDHDKIINTFLPDGAVLHISKTVRGHENMRHFLEDYYGYLIPGIGRVAANHVVDRDDDGGLVVRYQQSLLRYGYAEDDSSTAGNGDTEKRDGLPAIWWFAACIDRLSMTEEGWKIKERILGPSYRNANIDLPLEK